MVVLPQRLYNSSDHCQHPFSQKIEIGSAIHTPLDQLQTMDMPLNGHCCTRLRPPPPPPHNRAGGPAQTG